MTAPKFRVLGRLESQTLLDLKYRIRHPARADGRFIIDAACKVHGGVRFLCETWPTRPSEALIVHRCLQYGEFSARPYLAGGRCDDSTRDCVLALYYDYCRRTSLDATDLMVRAYPGGELADQWDAVAWRRILNAAEWHGTEFPATWTAAAIQGLLISLNHQHRQHLARTLEEALALRDLAPVLSEAGEPS